MKLAALGKQSDIIQCTELARALILSGVLTEAQLGSIAARLIQGLSRLRSALAPGVDKEIDTLVKLFGRDYKGQTGAAAINSLIEATADYGDSIVVWGEWWEKLFYVFNLPEKYHEQIRHKVARESDILHSKEMERYEQEYHGHHRRNQRPVRSTRRQTRRPVLQQTLYDRLIAAGYDPTKIQAAGIAPSKVQETMQKAEEELRQCLIEVLAAPNVRRSLPLVLAQAGDPITEASLRNGLRKLWGGIKSRVKEFGADIANPSRVQDRFNKKLLKHENPRLAKYAVHLCADTLREHIAAILRENHLDPDAIQRALRDYNSASPDKQRLTQLQLKHLMPMLQKAWPDATAGSVPL